MVLTKATKGLYSLLTNSILPNLIRNLTSSSSSSSISTVSSAAAGLSCSEKILPQVRKLSVSAAMVLPKEVEDQIDPIQRQLLAEECILLNDNDQVIGHGSKKDCHLVTPQGDVPLHRAFSVFLFNTRGELLLQQRSNTKITFPMMWTNTCCSHPLFCNDELEEAGASGIKSAAQRRLQIELGIRKEEIPLEDFHYLTRIHYKALSNSIWGEHEIDYILFLQKDVQIDPNLNEIQNVRYISQEELISMKEDEAIQLTPWFKLIANKTLPIWWNNLNNLKQFEDHSTIHRML